MSQSLANQESVYETLPRMKFITRHSTKRIGLKLPETAGEDLDKNRSDLVKNKPKSFSDNVKEEHDSDNLLDKQIPQETVSITKMMVKTSKNQKQPEKMRSDTILFKAGSASESNHPDGSATSETHESPTKSMIRIEDSKILTVNEEIVIISTANNDEHSAVREELFERLSEGHTET